MAKAKALTISLFFCFVSLCVFICMETAGALERKAKKIEHSAIPNCGNRRNNSTFKIQNSTFIRTADPRRSGTRSRG